VFNKFLVTIFTYIVLCFICYPRPCWYIKKEIKKSVKKNSEKRKEKEQKKNRRRGKGLYCGLLTENSVHIQILGDLYISNIISFEHIKPLGFQYRSLPCLATYSST